VRTNGTVEAAEVELLVQETHDPELLRYDTVSRTAALLLYQSPMVYERPAVMAIAQEPESLTDSKVRLPFLELLMVIRSANEPEWASLTRA